MFPNRYFTEKYFSNRYFPAGYTPADQTLEPSSISSSESISTPIVITPIVPNRGINRRVLTNITLFGTFDEVLSVDKTILPSAISSSETFGSHIVSLNNLQNFPTAIESSLAFGLATISITVTPSAISSSEAFGDVLIPILPDAIISQESFGNAIITIFANPTGISDGSSFGVPGIADNVYPSAFTSGTVGNASVYYESFVKSLSIDDGLFGTPIVHGTYNGSGAVAVEITGFGVGSFTAPPLIGEFGEFSINKLNSAVLSRYGWGRIDSEILDDNSAYLQTAMSPEVDFAVEEAKAERAKARAQKRRNNREPTPEPIEIEVNEPIESIVKIRPTAFDISGSLMRRRKLRPQEAISCTRVAVSSLETAQEPLNVNERERRAKERYLKRLSERPLAVPLYQESVKISDDKIVPPKSKLINKFRR